MSIGGVFGFERTISEPSRTILSNVVRHAQRVSPGVNSVKTANRVSAGVEVNIRFAEENK